MKNLLFRIALCFLPMYVFSQNKFEAIPSTLLVVQSRDQILVWYDDYKKSREGLIGNSYDPFSSEPWKPMVVDTNLFRIVKFTRDELGIEPRKLSPSMEIYSSAHYYGKEIAPDYKMANCTELMTALLSRHYTLTISQQKQINVVVPGVSGAQIIGELKAGKSKPAYGGVCHFVEANNYGDRIHYWEDILPGDLVQWWWFAGQSGHCGIIREVNKKERWFSIYSSTPEQGFGVTKYPIDFDAYFYFARITKTQKNL